MKPSSSTADMVDESMNIADDGVVRGSSLSVDVQRSSTYNLPFCMPVIRRHTCNQFLPFCPTFAGCAWVQQRLCRRDAPAAAATDDNADNAEEQVELQ